jgi:hypothetical protein
MASSPFREMARRRVRSVQCPFYALKALKCYSDGRQIRVVQTETGGGFGGKEEYRR